MDRRAEPTAGMSLLESLVGIALMSTVIVIATQLLVVNNRLLVDQENRVTLHQNAAITLDEVTRELEMAGYGVDTLTVADLGADGQSGTADDDVGQRKLVLAGPYDLMFNSARDPSLEAVDLVAAPGTLPGGYAPTVFTTGAETRRLTIDSDGDGSIGPSDQGDDLDELTVANPSLYQLRVEIYGYDGQTNVQPVRRLGLVRGPDAYPTGHVPPPIFQYWGQFDTDPEIDLWGDDGSGGGVAGDGLLQQGEILALTPVQDEDLNDNRILDSGEDRDGDQYLDDRLEDSIELVQVTLLGESPYPNWQRPDRAHSSTSEDYPYRDYRVTSTVRPHNLGVPGGICGGEPEPVASPSVTSACADPLYPDRARLTWTLSNDDAGGEQDIERYLVYRTSIQGIYSFTPHSEVTSGVSEWLDDNVDIVSHPMPQLHYRVRAMDCTPSLSELNPETGPFPSVRGPAPAEGVSLTTLPGSGAPSISWVPSDDDPSNTSGVGGAVVEYNLYRSNSSDFRCLAPTNTSVVGAGGASYSIVDTGVDTWPAPTMGELYYYTVRAMNSSGVPSPTSGVVCSRPTPGPRPPVDLSADVSGTTIKLTFKHNPLNVDPADGITDYDLTQIVYRIYRSEEIPFKQQPSGKPDSYVGYPAGYTVDQNYVGQVTAGPDDLTTAMEFADTGVMAQSGVNYYYVVTAAYSVGDPALDGEWGLTADRDASTEGLYDDDDDQILVDECANFELIVQAP